MWSLVLLGMFSQIAKGVTTRYNVTFSEDSESARQPYNSGTSYYDYYENQDSTMDTSSSYYAPVVHQHPASYYRPVPVEYYPQYEDPKYQQGPTEDICTWGRSFMENILQIGAAKLGILGLVKAVGAGFITKLPLILFKLLALPIGLIILKLPLLLPILLPILAMFIPIPVVSQYGYGPEECKQNKEDCEAAREKGKSKHMEDRISRAFKAFMQSEACVGRLACELGNLNAESEYKQNIKWLLGYMERAAPESEKSVLSTYKDAYLRGNEGMSCVNDSYECDLGQVVSAIYVDSVS